ncbi:sigma-70 family RNA polymerase sigma factor [Muribaculaceae bacterium Isolate-113 (HZI)]|nr:sigma-70 family RNA polymerase sigma factor [Muribaculaceae bacterium Isolate-114 (HZI)]ROT18995.1 sigma-70 family RNA polymerase sigma factor [Muribaculaceae bacterium Isolate-113 (HZI)]
MTAKEFDKEYRRLLLPLGMYALRIIGSVGDSEDVVQTVFLKTWDRIRAGFEPENLKAYLYMAVRNASLRHLSAKADELTDDIEDAAEVTEEDVDTSERDARLWKAVEELPERCRMIFLLCKRDGLSYKDVASELSISEKTVENQMTKAMKSLRKAYGIKSDRNVQINIFFLPFL